MGKKKAPRDALPAGVIPSAGSIPPESKNLHLSHLFFSRDKKGSGSLLIVGREVQLVWYDTEQDWRKQRNGRLVCMLEFQRCERRMTIDGDRYHFHGLLMEDLSGSYRKWASTQAEQGRGFDDSVEVLETRVHFSVAVIERVRQFSLASMNLPKVQPFIMHKPSLDDLSSPQLDMLFDIMSHLLNAIPSFKLMEDLEEQKRQALLEKRTEQERDVAVKRVEVIASAETLRQLSVRAETAAERHEIAVQAATEEQRGRRERLARLQERLEFTSRRVTDNQQAIRKHQAAALRSVKEHGPRSKATQALMRETEALQEISPELEERRRRADKALREAERLGRISERQALIAEQTAKALLLQIQAELGAAQRAHQLLGQALAEAVMRLEQTNRELKEHSST